MDKRNITNWIESKASFLCVAVSCYERRISE